MRLGSGFGLWASGSLLEVLPAPGVKLGSPPTMVYENNLPTSRDLADLGDVDACYSGRDSLAFVRSEEQFVVVAPVEGELNIDFMSGLANLRTRNCIHPDLRANPAFVADVPEIGGESVAEIDHGCGQTLFTQKSANLDAGYGIEMAWIIGWTEFLVIG